MSYNQKLQIDSAIRRFASGNMFENGIELFKTLNYPSHLQAPLDDPTWMGFKASYLQLVDFYEKNALTEEWKYVNILFQISENAIRQQMDIFSGGRIDNSIIHSFLYVCLELKKDHYTKIQLSQITREINKVFAMPAIILFKTGAYLTLAVINRRLHKHDESKDVLEKVTLIKDIFIESPHRAHLEILFDLSFDELRRKHGFTNFVELYHAWQKTLDIKELNKRFFRQLFNWYLWAIRNVSFPNKMDDATDDTTFNQEAVIRLLTRLIFIWFIKEKKLVPDCLFDNRFIKTVLRDFDPLSTKKSDYYRAILQNLFFATLNTPMDKDITDENRDEKRGFIEPGMTGGRANPHYTDQTRYRYKEYFTNEQTALRLFETIPFLNGGLFECLDFPPEDGQPELRIDGFSTKKDKQAFVPNALFFSKEFLSDLNEEYGTKGKQYKVEGLINIFDGYKFTITENTPLEEEVALDPELLGKVFENLLASYNPETKTTARKQTGSFYTPREIVNYMVDESLIAFLANTFDKGEEKEDSEKEKTEYNLRLLFNPTTDHHDFTEEETRQLIHSLSHCRILDPACGSGAFPMGILHRMVDMLGKLDPDNNFWKEIQKERAIEETKEAYDIGDQEERRHRLEEINKAFDESINNPDYARKLFLIENCIYGVDIQQIAVQIAKLRFFISLVAEQKVDDSKPNRNILSMPNLETKFVAANTLIGLEKPQGQLSLMEMNTDIEIKEKELKVLRQKIFFTRQYHEKKALKKVEKNLRLELKNLLIQSNFSTSEAEQVTSWNPFDPLRSSPFFDIETMFGFTGGFNVVIGNPPYVDSENMVKHFPNLRELISKTYDSTKGNWDLYIAFYEKAFKLLKEKGYAIYITPNKWLSATYGRELRKFIRKYFVKLTNCSKIKVFEAGNTPIIFSFGYTEQPPSVFEFEDDWQIKFLSFINNQSLDQDNWGALLSKYLNLLNRIDSYPIKLKNICSVENPFSTSEAYKLSEIVKEDINYINAFKLVTTGTIDPFEALWGKKPTSYLKKKYQYPIVKKSDIKNLLPKRYKQQNCSKIAISGMRYFESFYDTNSEYLSSKSTIIIKNIDNHQLGYSLVGFLNSKIVTFYLKESYSAMGIDGGINFSKEMVEYLPVSDDFPNPILSAVSKMVSLLKIQVNSSIYDDFLNRLIDAVVYELYLPEFIKAAECEVLKHLNNLPELKEGDEEETIKKNLKNVEGIYKELSNSKHPVSIAMERMKDVEEVRIIEGRL
jgi:hypothetical protein